MMAMNVSLPGVPQAAPAPTAVVAIDKRAELQMLLLKKALEAQREQTAELMRLADGKGAVLDIRV